MLSNRVMPILLLSKGGLVKTSRFSNPSYIGDPINAIRIFNDKEVDELVLLDIDASKNNTEPNYDLIELIAGECFMPLSYGGGIKNIDQARKLFSLGVEKVSIQNSLLDDYKLLNEIASKFGSSSVIASIDLKKDWLGKLKLYSSAKGKKLDMSWKEHFRNCIEAGAGEILLNSVDNDGTRKGTNLSMIKEASAITSIPLIAAGGVGSLDDIKLSVEAGANAIGVGAFFVYHGPHRAVLITYPDYDVLQNLLGTK